MKRLVSLIISTAFVMVMAQSQDDYSQGEQKSGGKGLLDPSRFTVHNMVSFGAATGSGLSDIKSQSLYSTMLQYQFTAPVTLNLNFSMPIFSTFNSTQNLTRDNIQSLAYFKNMPWDVSLAWKPTQNLQMRLSVINQPAFINPYYSGYRYDMFGDRLPNINDQQ